MRYIKADYSNVKGEFNRFASLCAGAGRAAEALRKDFMQHLEIVQKECGFQYLRFHGIFHEDMGVYSEDKLGNGIYNWQYVDIVYDAILDTGMKPFVELSFMPKIMADGEQTVFWWETNVNPPRDYQKWYSLISRFMTHLEERYGREELLTWYFEVWNEPNHPAFFTASINEYFRMYDLAVKAIKEVCSGFRVGGPATAGNAWVSEFIDHCYNNNVPVDFVSTHIYGVRGDFDEFGDSILCLAEDKDLIINAVKEVYEKVKSSKMPQLEIHRRHSTADLGCLTFRD